jgi:hypothetical protein
MPLTATAAVGLLAVATPTRAAEFTEAEIYVELNDTDGDLGLHSSIDGGPYRRLEIEDPRGRMTLLVEPKGRLARQGLTQLFFESAEPPFDELPPATFFQRFPEGTYEIEGISLEGEEFEAEAELSHVLADRVRNVTLSGLAAAEDCDAVPLPQLSGSVVIRWDPVTQSHPELGKPGPVEIAKYQFFVERADVKLAVDLPPSVTEFEVPAEILALGDDFKFEIVARTSTGNNTAVENCFLYQ